MAVRETTIMMDFIANADPLRDINNQINNTVRNTHRISQAYSGLEDAQKRMLNEMNKGWRSQDSAFLKYKNDLIAAEYEYHKLAKGTSFFSDSTSDLIQSIVTVGAMHKIATDGMINNDERARRSLYRTIGEYANKSTLASQNAAALDRLGNPLYSVNKGALSIVDSMEKLSNNTRAARVALEMLGPTASMKELRNETERIKKGLGAMGMVAIGAGLGAFFFYKGLHSLAMESEAYAGALEKMKSSLRKAIQPMVDVFIMIMVPIFKFITFIADLIVKFNEAHPVIAKMVQGTMLLVPALTLLLLPLGLGLGLVKGYAVAFGYFFKMIRPVAVFLGTMSATVWIVAAAIIALGAAFIWAWKNVDWFRKGIIAAWNWIKENTVIAFEAVKNAIMPAILAIVEFVRVQLEVFKAFWAANGTEIISIVKTAFSTVWSYIKMVLGIIKGIFQVVWPQVVGVLKVAWALIQTVVSTAIDVVLGIIKTIMAIIKGDWQGAWDAIKGIFVDTWENIKKYLGGIDLFQIGKDMMMGLIKGISSMVKAVKDSVTGVVDSIKNAITGKKGLDQHSPSRVMIQYGIDTWKGYNIGQADQLREVQAITNMVANVPVEYMNSGLGSTSTTSNTKKTINFNPTIQVSGAGGNPGPIKQAVGEALDEFMGYLNTVYVTEGDI